MKKRIVIVLLILMAFCFISPKTEASIMGDDEGYLPPINQQFNVIRGKKINDFKKLNDYTALVTSNVTDGYIQYEMYGLFGEDMYTFTAKHYISYGDLVGYEYYFEDELFYKVENINYPDMDVVVDKEFDLCEYFNDYSSVFLPSNTGVYLHIDEYVSGGDETDIPEDIDYFGFMWSEVTYYQVNKKYANDHIYYTFEYENPPKIEDILKEIKVVDESECTVSIDNNTYDPDNVRVNEVYSFRVIAKDEKLNITIQWINIKAVDVIKPSIELKESIVLEYNEIKTKEDLKSYFTVTDNSKESLQYIFDIDAYNNSNNKVGEYSCSLIVQDSSKNEASLDFTIEIKDRTKPVILALGNTITVGNTHLMTEEELRDNLSASDEYDGDLTNNITLDGYEDYAKNYETISVRSITAKVSDAAGNETSLVLTINIEDSKNPEIEFTEPVIVVEKGKPLTREDIIQFFKDRGYDIDENGLESDYFSEEYVDGDYDLIIRTLDGKEIKAKITTEVNDDISYEIPTKEEPKNYTTIIIISSVVGAIILVCVVLGVIIYKKRH